MNVQGFDEYTRKHAVPRNFVQSNVVNNVMFSDKQMSTNAFNKFKVTAIGSAGQLEIRGRKL